MNSGFDFLSTTSSTVMKFLRLTCWLTLGTLIISGCRHNDTSRDLQQVRKTASALVETNGYPAALAVQVSPTSRAFSIKGARTAGGDAVTASDAFPMGSITKSMTATLAAILVQEGVIGWNTKLVDTIPDLQPFALEEYRAVTLFDLLAHRGGIFAATSPDQIALLPGFTGTPAEQRLQLLIWATQQAPEIIPGVETEYSNGGYIAAAAMLEQVTQRPYETLLQDKLFGPLNVQVSFGSPGSNAQEPQGHWTSDGQHWQSVDPADPDVEFPAFANPAGGAKLNGDALARYLQLHLNALLGKTGLLLTPDAALFLHTEVENGFALGWISGADLSGTALTWHNGSDDFSYSALMAVSKSKKSGVAVVVTGYRDTTAAETSQALLDMLN